MPEDDPLALEALTDDALTARLRVWQRARGHRYSVDDVATAWEAARACPDAARVADLGAGLGSVALMLADALPAARIEAIEAQAISFALLARNVARNGLDARVRIHHGDLRDEALAARLEGPFDLVTGTPPYVPAREVTLPPDSQRAHARVELRGGVEDYLAAMGRLLAPTGLAVICADARRPSRVLEGARRAGLRARTRRDLVPRAGKDALFAVWTLARDGAEDASLEVHAPLVLREADGARTEASRALRAFFGLEGPRDEAPSPPQRVRRVAPMERA